MHWRIEQRKLPVIVATLLYDVIIVERHRYPTGEFDAS
jgi:hypothetical protein